MKTTILKYLVCIGLLVATAGCKPDMDLSNPSESTVSTYYKTEAQLQASLVPAYEALIGRDQGGYCFQVLFAFLAPGDDYSRTYKWTSMYQDTYNTPASDGIVQVAWMDMFNGVFASNIAIDRITNYKGIDASTDDKNTMLGQAYFLRGLFYLNLCSFYGETIPLYNHPTTTTADYYPSNAKSGEVYAQIVSDFSKAASLLPVKSKLYADASNVGRATQGAAQAFLAKAYLWRPILEKGQTAEYAKAQTVLESLIGSKEYQLNSNFHDNFTDDPKKENGKESIFEVQMHTGPGWIGSDLSDSWRWCNIGLPDGTGGSWWNLAPTKMAYDEFETGDPRRYMTLWCPGGAYYTAQDGSKVTFEQMMNNVASDKDKYGTRKECPDAFSQYNGNISDDFNDPLMRYADVLLMYAECLHAGSGNDNKAITDPSGTKYWIQQVRNRANNIVPSEQSQLWYSTSNGTIPTVDDLMAAAPIINGFKMNNIMNVIEHERCVELMGEYYRYFDLLRLGMADPIYLKPLTDLGWTAKAMYYPFPQQELNNNKNLKGNAMN